MIVNVIGKGESSHLAFDKEFQDEEVWCINSIAFDPHIVRYDKIFYFDRIFETLPDFNFVEKSKIINFYNYPLPSILKSVEGALKYFTSSVSYVIAYAAWIEPDRINLYGVDLHNPDEYAVFLPCVMYWMAILHMLEIDVYVPEKSTMLNSRFSLYGDTTWKSSVRPEAENGLIKFN